VPTPDSTPPGGGTAVVIAIGNEFRRDDGAGPAVLLKLRDLVPAGVDLGLDDAIGLALALDRMPGRLIVHAIEAADLSQGPGLTPEVAAAVDPVASAILEDLGAVPG
jgi:Ni,Fe-hydrogenase maturation factor